MKDFTLLLFYLPSKVKSDTDLLETLICFRERKQDLYSIIELTQKGRERSALQPFGIFFKCNHKTEAFPRDKLSCALRSLSALQKSRWSLKSEEMPPVTCIRLKMFQGKLEKEAK